MILEDCKYFGLVLIVYNRVIPCLLSLLVHWWRLTQILIPLYKPSCDHLGLVDMLEVTMGRHSRRILIIC